MIKRFFLIITVVFTFSACSSKSKVIYIDPGSIQNVDIFYSPEDLNLLVEAMVSGMLRSKIFDGKPVIDMRRITNDTYEHIDTRAISNSIKTAIIKSGRAQFIVDSSIKTDHKIVPDYILHGSLMSMPQKNSMVIGNFYKFTLQLDNVKTSLIVWMEEKKIRKEKKRKPIGW